MDKKELLKRWALAYTEPSLFYVPWKNNQKPYGEYITVTFKSQYFIFKNWQRQPVFAIYYADDSEYKNPIYCTALYDQNYNIVSNGIHSNQSFYVGNKHGDSWSMKLLHSGKYKIRMLCSGGGMITNGIKEWEFTVDRSSAQSTIYEGEQIDYSNRNIEIDPFKGYKYLQIDCEAELVKTTTSKESTKREVLQSFNISGYDFAETDSYLYLHRGNIDDYCAENQVKCYLMRAVINEKMSNGKDDTILISQRGKKKILRNKGYIRWRDDYYHIHYHDGLELSNQTTVDLVKYDYENFGNIEYTFYLGTSTHCYSYYISMWRNTNDGSNPNTYRLRDSGGCGVSNSSSIGNPELVSVDVSLYDAWWGTDKNNLKFKYANKKKVILAGGGGYGISSDNYFEPFPIRDVKGSAFNSQVSTLYLNREKQFDEICKQEFSTIYEHEDLHEYIEPNDYCLVPTYAIISDTKIPNLNIPEVKVYGVQMDCPAPPEGGTIIDIYEEKTGEYIEIPPEFSVVDLGVDWQGYDHHEDIDNWSDTRLYNTELEVYNPELIPKESGGET